MDKTHLHSAMTVMTQVAAAINEYKRRKDLGESANFIHFIHIYNWVILMALEILNSEFVVKLG